MPQRVREALREQIEAVRRLHERDLEEGFGTVYPRVMNKPGLAVRSPADALG